MDCFKKKIVCKFVKWMLKGIGYSYGYIFFLVLFGDNKE